MIKRLLVLLLTLTTTSCFKEDLREGDGNVVGSQTILSNVCYKLGAEQIKKMNIGESSLATKSVAYFNGASAVSEIHGLEVLSKDLKDCDVGDNQTLPCNQYDYVEMIHFTDTNDEFHFERSAVLPVVEEEQSLASNLRKVHEYLGKNQIAAKLETESDNELLFSSIDQEICYFTQDMYRKVDITMTFHNFTKKQFTGEPPKAVRERPDCEGIPNCKIRVEEYEFDQLFVFKDGSRFKRRFKYQISNDVPYTSRYLTRCLTESIPVHFDDNENGQVDEGEIRIVPAHQCREVVDFAYSTASNIAL